MSMATKAATPDSGRRKKAAIMARRSISPMTPQITSKTASTTQSHNVKNKT
jgi:hypothetical protein